MIHKKYYLENNRISGLLRKKNILFSQYWGDK